MWFECGILLSALVAVFLPHAWMNFVHGQMGMGDLPQGAIVEYLTRSLSLVYASMAPLCGFLARDVRRYREVIAFQAVVKVVFGLALLALDLALGMPLFWTVCEGPLIVLLSLLVWRMARATSDEG